MRLLADENIAQTVISGLRSDGHDVFSVREEAAGSTDVQVLQRAFTESLIILTHDADFGNIFRYPVSAHRGVILIRLRDQSPASVLRRLRSVMRSIAFERLRDHLAIVSEDRTRMYPSS